MTPTELKKARQKMGLTQSQLADKLGVQRLAVVRMENGDRSITKTTEILIGYLLKE